MSIESLCLPSLGVSYYESRANAVICAERDDLYYYQVLVGAHRFNVERGDCVYYLSDDKQVAYLRRGPSQVWSSHFAVIIRGYMPENKSCGLSGGMVLPYINGCSARQVFPPERLGDPTLQLLKIPANTKEQAHHIHSTVRVVYVLAGEARCVVGTSEKTVVEKLMPGMTVILSKMSPHHFETLEQNLLVLTLHVFSSMGALENNHPMYNGTAIL